jgi:hypothetical protein
LACPAGGPPRRMIFLVLFASRQKEHKSYSNNVYVLSFACAKERTKEKHTGNDIQPLPDALIKL